MLLLGNLDRIWTKRIFLSKLVRRNDVQHCHTTDKNFRIFLNIFPKIIRKSNVLQLKMWRFCSEFKMFLDISDKIRKLNHVISKCFFHEIFQTFKLNAREDSCINSKFCSKCSNIRTFDVFQLIYENSLFKRFSKKNNCFCAFCWITI